MARIHGSIRRCIVGHRLLKYGVALAFVFISGTRGGITAPEPAPDAAPKEVRALVGTYTGAWTSYGIDAKGEVVKRMAWTDVITAEKPEVKEGRAFVTTLNTMTFEGGMPPPVKVQGKEGYFLKEDGTPGDYFVENFGQVQRLVKLAGNVWTSTASLTPQEMTRMGFPSDSYGQYVIVKVVTKEEGVETHRISRLTTVCWKKDGKERTLQFLSLQGYHKRQP
jgi:hypothetical protein